MSFLPTMAKIFEHDQKVFMESAIAATPTNGLCYCNVLFLQFKNIKLGLPFCLLFNSEAMFQPQHSIVSWFL